MKKFILTALATLVAALVMASPAAAISSSWCYDTLRGKVGDGQPSYVKDNDVGFIRKWAENYYDINIVSNQVTRSYLAWGSYGADTNGAIKVTIAYYLDTGNWRTYDFWCEKNGIFTDWPVGYSKWGVFNP